MGLGDDIMATAFAKLEKEKYPDRQIIVGNFDKKIGVDSIIYENNPYITLQKNLVTNKIVHFVNNHADNRPYIDWDKTNLNNYVWNFKFSPSPGQIFLSNSEIQNSKKIIEEAKKYWCEKNTQPLKKIIFIEPTSTKIGEEHYLHFKHLNKDWGIQNWLELAEIIGNEYLIIQSTHDQETSLKNVYKCNVDFRTACAIINECDLFLGPEGGLGHAAAALSKPAVIIFGGWIHPSVTGYSFHENIYIDIKGSPCGARSYQCDHCKKCMKQITITDVIDSIKKFI